MAADVEPWRDDVMNLLSCHQWALELHDFTGKFPDLPEEVDGGSTLIWSKKSLRDVEEDLDELEEKMKKFKKDKKDEKKGKKEKQEKPAVKKKPKKPVDQEFSWVMPESKVGCLKIQYKNTKNIFRIISTLFKGKVESSYY